MFFFAGVALYLFFMVNSNDGVEVGTIKSGSLESIDEAGLKSALTLFEKKKDTLEKLLIAPPSIIDPSL